MQERSVTVAGTTHRLLPPFFVLATQNPLEMEGTYPLPEAQLDRFFFKLLVKYPDRPGAGDDPRPDDRSRSNRASSPVFDGQRIVELSRLARQIPIADELKRYAVALILATHPENPRASDMAKRFVRYGSSPRGAQAMILGAKIRAILDHRYHVAREDLRACARPALRHRLILNFEGQAENIQADDIIDDILKSVETPGRGGVIKAPAAIPTRHAFGSSLMATRYGSLRLRFSEEAGIPVAGVATRVSRPVAGPAPDDAAWRRHRVCRPSRVHARR